MATLTTKPAELPKPDLYGDPRMMRGGGLPLGSGGQVNTGGSGPININQAGGYDMQGNPVSQPAGAQSLTGSKEPVISVTGDPRAMVGKSAGAPATAPPPAPGSPAAAGTPTAAGAAAAGASGTGAGASPAAPTNPLAPPGDIAIPDWHPGDVHMMTREVGDNELVQGQLARILASDNPIMTSARNRAMQFANERGLLNSSLAAQSGEQAVIDSAMPIASQDASTYGRQALANQDYSNQGILAKYGAENALGMNAVQFAQTRQLGVDQERAANRARAADQGFQREMFDKDATLKERLTNLDNASRERVGQMQVQAAQAAAAAQQAVAMAQIAAQERMQQTSIAASADAQSRDIASREGMFDANLSWQREANTSQLNSHAMDSYSQQFTSIMSSEMSYDDKQRALQNLNAMWNGSSMLPPGMFNPSAFGGH